MAETVRADAGAREHLFEAIKAGDLGRVRDLLEADPTLVDARTEGGVSAVVVAAYYGRGAIADLLVARGAALDVFAAAALGDVDRLVALIGTDRQLVESRSPDGWTPLHLAAHFGQPAAARALLDAGAEVEARSSNAMANTALHAALAGRHRDVAELLLGHGADPNARQHGGFTALQAAAQHGDLAMIELLLAHGAEPGLAADDGRTPLAMATAGGHDAAAELLRRAGA
jgi:uncharacterized protein